MGCFLNFCVKSLLLTKESLMLALAVRNTNKLVREKSKSENIRLGRLFTKRDCAKLMADMLSIDPERDTYTVLVPGAGTGILAAAVIEKICKSSSLCRQIFVSCYENNEEFADMLEDNLERIRKKCRHDYDVKLFSTVYRENYLTESRNHYTVTFFDEIPDKFDIIIANPPSEIYDKSSPETICVGGITQLKTKAQHLFLKLAGTHLEDGGQLVFMLPSETATAAALAPLRRDIMSSLTLSRIHLFTGKQKNPKRPVPIGKNSVFAFKKTDTKDDIYISVSTDWGTPDKTAILPPLPYTLIVKDGGTAITLPKSVEEARIAKYISSFPETISSLGLKVSTGVVIDTRCEKLLLDEPMDTSVPIIRPASMQNGQIVFPMDGVHRQYLSPLDTRLLQKNKNMIIIKRIPAVSDDRFLKASIYLAGQMPKYRYISTHNKINYIDTKDKNGEICARLAFGLFALLNSTIYDRFVSVFSKSKQINAKELKSLPLPPRNIIENIGMRLMAARDLSTSACDKIVNPTLHIIEK